MKLSGRKCQCMVCGQYFTTVANFDRHRDGKYAVGRHCINPADAGLVLKDGLWRQPGADFSAMFGGQEREGVA